LSDAERLTLRLVLTGGLAIYLLWRGSDHWLVLLLTTDRCRWCRRWRTCCRWCAGSRWPGAADQRDIKTSNIQLRPDGTAKIIDFGIGNRALNALFRQEVE
jgi:hypothetical protein